jgi:tetratricopeptide (TPR) repeat protein
VDLSIGVNLNRPLGGGAVRVKDKGNVVRSEPLDLTPAQAHVRVVSGLPSGPRYTVEVVEGSGPVRIAHTEGVFDFVSESEIKLGPQPVTAFPAPDKRSDGDFVALGDQQERDGQRLAAWKTYEDGLLRFPESFGLLKAAGRLAVGLKRPAEAVPLLTKALARVSNEGEVQFYLGLAQVAIGDETKARGLWEGAQILAPFRPAARLELVRLDARGGDHARALERLRTLLEESPDAVRAGGLEMALLRRLGRADEARKRLAYWRALDPTANLLRHEAVKLGSDEASDEAGLWLHLAGDPERVLDVAEDYMALGFYDDAVELLARRYPTGPGVMAEAGTAAPQDHPLVAYYRGFCREKAGQSGKDDYRTARSLSTRYVFPSRASSFPVLRAALAADANDATAHFLMGSLLLSTGRTDEAIAEWDESRRLDPKIPVLHRNLGMTRLFARGEAEQALALFVEGMGVDGTNTALYVGADQAQSLLGRPLEERIRTLERYPDRATMAPLLVEKLALALAEAGRTDEAEALFAGRFFPREENGTNVRQVWIEARLRRAHALARAGQSAEALAIVASLDRPRPGLEFTRDGLQAFIKTVRVQYVLGEILAACGQTKEARAHWQRAVDGHDWAGIKPVFATLAARRLGSVDEAAQTRELEASLARSEAHLASGTGFPGIAVYAQGLHLRALGREDEARERLRRVFLLPDQLLSHFLARRALEGADPL